MAIPITQGYWTVPLLTGAFLNLKAGLLMAGFDALYQLEALDLFQVNPFVGAGAVLLLDWLGREYALRAEDEPAPAS